MCEMCELRTGCLCPFASEAHLLRVPDGSLDVGRARDLGDFGLTRLNMGLDFELFLSSERD